jgi:hypothetical protein
VGIGCRLREQRDFTEPSAEKLTVYGIEISEKTIGKRPALEIHSKIQFFTKKTLERIGRGLPF